jgi:hypothetical protein
MAISVVKTSTLKVALTRELLLNWRCSQEKAMRTHTLKEMTKYSDLIRLQTIAYNSTNMTMQM